MFNAPKLKSLVFKYSWMKYLFWLSCILIIAPLVLFIFGAIEAVFMMFLGALFLCISGTLLGLGNIGAIKQAYQAGDWAQQDYEHYTFRAKLGLLFFGIPAACGILFLLFMVVEQKVNLTITAVPTPELMAEMKYFWGDPDVKHSPVKFNGQEQEVVFYTEQPKYSGVPSLISRTKGNFPEYYLQDKKLTIDYLEKYKIEVLEINNQRKCFYTRNILTPIDNVTDFTEVRSNLPFEDFGIYVFDKKLAIDVTASFETRDKQKGCWYYYLNQSGAKDIFRTNMTAYLEQPIVAFNTSNAVDSSRLTLANWNRLNKKFQSLAR